jgi:hypothetical protein
MVKKLLVLFMAVGLCLTFGLGTAKALPVLTSEGGIGDLLFFPLYDVRPTADRSANWQNYITIENTSQMWTAAHLRFRTWRKSIEVYDHIILLSPYDVFYLVIERQADGSVLLWSRDTATCINSGLIWADNAPPADTVWSTPLQTYLLEECGYTVAAGYDLNEELQAGYVEVIGLWQLSREAPAIECVNGAYVYAVPNPAQDTSILANVVSNNYNDGHPGAVNVFDVLEALFWNLNAAAAGNYAGLPAQPDWPFRGPPAQQDNVIRVSTINGLAEVGLDGNQRWGIDCQNVLKAEMVMGDATTSQYEMANFVAIADFRTENWTTTLAGLGTYTRANLHRDTHDFGAIVFPTDIMFWLPYDRNGLGDGIDPYINENWATTIGPGIRDGDDWNQDRTGAVPWAGWLPIAGILRNWNTQVGDPLGLNALLWAVAPFNDIWSLDDVERVMAKNNIWYQYFNNAFGATYTTDVNLTWPTKHYHWFFADWAFWNDTDHAPPFLNPYDPNTVGFYPWGIGGAPATAFASVNDYWNDVQTYRSANADRAGVSIATRFDAIYDNGPLSAGVTIWDMDEHTVAGGEPPPGSPWVPTAPQRIPHEANIIRVGAAAGTGSGITDANGVINTAYDMGQFTIGAIRLLQGQRFTARHILYDPNLDSIDQASYLLPPIGVMMFDLRYGARDYRSTMAPWDYTFTFWP